MYVFAIALGEAVGMAAVWCDHIQDRIELGHLVRRHCKALQLLGEVGQVAAWPCAAAAAATAAAATATGTIATSVAAEFGATAPAAAAAAAAAVCVATV
jgi:hypothetical protein